MKLCDVLNSLKEMKFVTDNTKIALVVNKGRSLKKDDQIFECHISVLHAGHFFGDLNVTLNQIRKIDEYNVMFWFLLAYEE